MNIFMNRAMCNQKKNKQQIKKCCSFFALGKLPGPKSKDNEDRFQFSWFLTLEWFIYDMKSQTFLWIFRIINNVKIYLENIFDTIWNCNECAHKTTFQLNFMNRFNFQILLTVLFSIVTRLRLAVCQWIAHCSTQFCYPTWIRFSIELSCNVFLWMFCVAKFFMLMSCRFAQFY